MGVPMVSAPSQSTASQATVSNDLYLATDYAPSGTIDDGDVAAAVVSEAGLTTPAPVSPMVNMREWRRVIDMFSCPTMTQLAQDYHDPMLRPVFRALSFRLDENTPFSVEDCVSVRLGPTIPEEERSARRQHAYNAYAHALETLPPVTAGLLGSWLREMTLYEKDYYAETILPDDCRWGGMHHPHRGRIDVAGSCYCDFAAHDYPDPAAGSSCTVLHEIGHAIHSIYGFYRPVDISYRYDVDSIEDRTSTGCISPVSLSPTQSRFVYDMIRAYTLHHREAFDTINYKGYGKTHPAEAFAVAFEFLLRKGGRRLRTEYEQFNDVMTHFV